MKKKDITKRIFTIFMSIIMINYVTAVTYEITTWDELNDIRLDLTGDYILMNDINSSTEGFETYQIGNGFVPVGNYSDVGFTGSFDGQNHTIDRLYSVDYYESPGIFGHISNSFIKDIRLTNVNITGQNRVGGLVGHSQISEYHNIYVHGSVIGDIGVGGIIGATIDDEGDTNVNTNLTFIGNIIGRKSVGGIIGYFDDKFNIHTAYVNANIISTNGTAGGLIGQISYIDTETINFDEIHVEANISVNNTAGGLIGQIVGNYYDINIDNSYTTGNINTTGNITGGLIGDSKGKYTSAGYGSAYIDNSYSTMNIVGNNRIVGGLIGDASGPMSNIISNSFFAGSINLSGTSVESLGGLVGNGLLSSITNSYWINRTDNVTDCYSQGNLGCTTVNSEDYFYNYSSSPINNWTFDSIWSDAAEFYTYPLLSNTDNSKTSNPIIHTWVSRFWGVVASLSRQGDFLLFGKLKFLKNSKSMEIYNDGGNLVLDPDDGIVSTSSNISANYFIGDGSLLTGYVGIGVSSPSTSLDVNGYTKLGDSSPKIKIKEYTGNTGSSGTVQIATTGISSSQILSVNCAIWVSSSTAYPPLSGSYTGNYWYRLLYYNTGFKMDTIKSPFWNKTYRCMMVYTE